MAKTKQSPPSNDRLGKHTSDMLIDTAKIIIGNTPNPIKLITAQIRYQMLVAKMYRENARRK